MSEAQALAEIARRIAADPEDWDAVADWARTALRSRPPEDFPIPGPLGNAATWLGDLLTLGPYPGEPETLLAWHPEQAALCRVSHRNFAIYDPDWQDAYRSQGRKLLAAGPASIARIIAWDADEDTAFAATPLHPNHSRPLLDGPLTDRLEALILAARGVYALAPLGLLTGGIELSSLRRDARGLVLLDLDRGAWAQMAPFALAIALPLAPRELVRLSPDMLAGRAQDPRDDVYCFGLALFEILAGRPPIEADSLNIGVHKILAPQNERDWDWTPIPRPFRALCQQALAREKSDRFPQLLAFAEALEAAGERVA